MFFTPTVEKWKKLFFKSPQHFSQLELLLKCFDSAFCSHAETPGITRDDINDARIETEMHRTLFFDQGYQGALHRPDSFSRSF
jgi:hypothetical protein